MTKEEKKKKKIIGSSLSLYLPQISFSLFLISLSQDASVSLPNGTWVEYTWISISFTQRIRHSTLSLYVHVLCRKSNASLKVILPSLIMPSFMPNFMPNLATYLSPRGLSFVHDFLKFKFSPQTISILCFSLSS